MLMKVLVHYSVMHIQSQLLLECCDIGKAALSCCIVEIVESYTGKEKVKLKIA